MITITLIIKTLLLSWVISHFEPIQWLLQEIKLKWTKLILITLTSCWKCCSLWTGLILTGNIWVAILSSVIASLLQIIKNKLKI